MFVEPHELCSFRNTTTAVMSQVACVYTRSADQIYTHTQINKHVSSHSIAHSHSLALAHSIAHLLRFQTVITNFQIALPITFDFSVLSQVLLFTNAERRRPLLYVRTFTSSCFVLPLSRPFSGTTVIFILVSSCVVNSQSANSFPNIVQPGVGKIDRVG